MADEYTNDIKDNPDYQLVMTFLQNIRPGDMDEESSQQLMAIGQRIQGGGTLTDREREMFEAVVGATDSFPTEQMDSFPQGTNPDIMKAPMAPVPMPQATPFQLDAEKLNQLRGSGQITEREGNRLEDELNLSYQVDDGQMQMTPRQMADLQQSGAITPDAGTVMSLEEAIAAGIVMPTRPQARPMMTSPRPQMRR